MFNRDDYMSKRCSHREYYAQLVNDHIRGIVKRRIGVETIRKSEGVRFNDIPLPIWDGLQQLISRSVYRDFGKEYLQSMGMNGLSLCNTVCTAKEAARQIKEEMEV